MSKVMEDLRKESFAKGQEEGRREQAQTAARNLSAQGLSVDQIAQAVGFSVKAVKEWLAQKAVQEDDRCYQESGKAFYFLIVRFIVQ